ncbi:MAG: S-layer homology domain-containing protein, partial [Slackia sp.]|nr:S-layer homology domain-containing protein [Slackia sp.]
AKDGTSIERCSVDAMKAVAAPERESYIGALCYSAADASISQCTVDSFEATDLNIASGLVAIMEGSAKAEGCAVRGMSAEAAAAGDSYATGLVYLVKEDSDSIVENCEVNDVQLSVARASGLAGFVKGAKEKADCTPKIIGSKVRNLVISGPKEASGLILSCGPKTLVSGCAVEKASMQGVGERAAGVVYVVKSGSRFQDCGARDIEIDGKASDLSYTGGFAGLVNADVDFTDCFVEGVVIEAKSGQQVGGFSGNVQNSSSIQPNTFTNCRVDGLRLKTYEAYPFDEKTHKSMVGGFIGTTGKIADFNACSVTGSIDAADSAGGFVGDLGWVSLSDENLDHKITFDACTADVDVSAQNTAGGFVGLSRVTYSTAGKNSPEKSTAAFGECVASGNVVSRGGVAGGFVGSGDRGEFSRCAVRGAVSGPIAGGFQGEVTANDFDAEADSHTTLISIENCSVSGTVLGSDSAGGVIGSISTVNPTNAKSNTRVEFAGETQSSPAVVGASADTEVFKVAHVDDADESNIGGIPSDSEGTAIVKPVGDGTLAMDEHGHVTIPDSGATRNGEPLSSGDVLTNLGSVAKGGSVDSETGSIVMKPGGSMTSPDGSVQTFPHGGSVSSDGAVDQVRPSLPSVPSYAVSVGGSVEGGTVIVGSHSASKGDTVKLSVRPEAGYKLDRIVAVDGDGKRVDVAMAEDGSYTFIMPDSEVKIDVFFLPTANPFVDVFEGDFYYEAALWASHNGITTGVGDGRFAPGESCTRAQMVTFLWRAAGSPEVASDQGFDDVAEDAYYADAVRWAAAEGVTTGTGDGSFSPDDVVTRAQVVTFLWRAAGSPASDAGLDFDDVDPDGYYADAVRWAVSEGVTTGTGEFSFSPDDDCTRGQGVTFLYRVR